MEAVGLLAKMRGTGRVPLSLVALLVCDCWRVARDVLCELDGPQNALARARADASASVRSWRPQGRKQPETLTLLDAL